MTISTAKLLDLLKIFEACGGGFIDADGKFCRGVPRYLLAKQYGSAGVLLGHWTQVTGYASSMLLECAQGEVEVDLCDTDDPSLYEYWCPETSRYRTVAAHAIEVHTVKESEFLHLIADLVGIPSAKRAEIELAVIPSVLWRLGRIRLGAVWVPVWLFRGRARYKSVLEALSRPDAEEMGLILTTSQPPDPAMQTPKGYRFVSIAKVLKAGDTAELDTTVLGRILGTYSPEEVQSHATVQWLNNTLTIPSLGRQWRVDGQKQRLAIGFMANQYAKGRTEIPSQEIIAAVYPEQERKGKRIGDLFSGSKQSDDFLMSPRKGIYAFKLMPEEMGM